MPGNHERVLHERPELRRLITNAVFLINESVTIEGVKLWGSPSPAMTKPSAARPPKSGGLYTPPFQPDTDIFVSHGPPYGVRDEEFRSGGIHRGCPELLAAVQRVQPQVHIFGHVHAGRGAVRIGPTTFINAAMLGWSGDLENKPISFDFPLGKKEEK